MALIIDRIEGDVAVVEMEDGSFTDVPLSCIAGEARDGATLARTSFGFAVDEEATAARRAAIQEKANRLFKRKK